MYDSQVENRKSGKFILAVIAAGIILLILVLQNAAGETAIAQPHPQEQQPTVFNQPQFNPAPRKHNQQCQLP